MRISDWSSDVCSADLFEAGGQREGGFEQQRERRILGDGLQRFGEAGDRAARRTALHLADAALDARCRLAVALDRLGLQEQHTEVEGNRIEAAGKGDACARRLDRKSVV